MPNKKNLYEDELLSAMTFLYDQMKGIDNYPDKSLFFQNPQIIEGWLILIRSIMDMKFWKFSEEAEEWVERTETNVAYLLAMRELYLKYENLYRVYYDHLRNLLECYGGWLEGECISADGMEALSADKYEDDLEDVEDIVQHLKDLNCNSLNARAAVHSVLSDVFKVLMAVMNRGGRIVIDLNPSSEDFAKAIDDDLREWTNHFGKGLIRDMKEDLNRHYKAHRTDHNTIELWSDMLDADEKALKMAKMQQLAECDDLKQEHWGEDMKKRMDENGRLMQQILSSCHTDELLDFGEAENVELFIPLLTPDNMDMFYDIIVRRSLIQCEMFPELKAQHDAWLKGNKEQQKTMTPAEKEVEEDTGVGIPTGAEAEENELIVKYNHFVEAVKTYNFLGCPAVACLNKTQRGQLVRKIVNRYDNYGAYAIAILCELEYDKWMMDNFAKNNPYSKKGLTKTEIFDHWKDALSLTSNRAVAGNYNIIRNPDSKEDKTIYKSYEYTRVAHEDYMAIKNNTHASE